MEVAPAGQRARVSEQALRQIVDVLVDNALQHGRGRVTVRAHPVATGVEVEVHDEGAGALDPEAIFARRSASARGHGIGLALARSLAEAEGGRLRLASGGEGTAFSLLLLGPEARGERLGAAVRGGRGSSGSSHAKECVQRYLCMAPPTPAPSVP